MNLKKLDGNPFSCRLIEEACKDFQEKLNYVIETGLCSKEPICEESDGASCASQTLKVSKALKKSLRVSALVMLMLTDFSHLVLIHKDTPENIEVI